LPVHLSILGRLRRFGASFARGIKSLASGIYRDDCLGLAAQVAYSILFSLFPFLLFLQALAAYITGTSVLTDWLLGGLRQLITVDSELYKIVKDNVFGEIGGTSATASCLRCGAPRAPSWC
jgi:uncharacterized BrkB/YihY/UPF0761 family membrane protein